MFDRFTDQSKLAMNGARLAAQRLSHDCLAPEHILLGILEVAPCSAKSMLDSFGVIASELVKEIESAFPAAGNPSGPGPLPFTESSKQVLTSCMLAAQSMGHGVLSTGHLLLGVFEEGSLKEQLSFATREQLKAGVEEHLQKDSCTEEPAQEVRNRISPLPRLNPEISRILRAASEEAARHGSPGINSAHVLLALLHGEGWTGKYLLEVGVDSEAIIRHLRE